MEQPEAYLGRLKPIYLFKGLSDDQILEVARELEVVTYPAGATVYQEGEAGQDFYIVNRGQVKVMRAKRGRQPQKVATFVPGDFFGEQAVLFGHKRNATVDTAAEGEL